MARFEIIDGGNTTAQNATTNVEQKVSRLQTVLFEEVDLYLAIQLPQFGWPDEFEPSFSARHACTLDSALACGEGASHRNTSILANKEKNNKKICRIACQGQEASRLCRTAH